jgi:hypothetical protein
MMENIFRINLAAALLLAATAGAARAADPEPFGLFVMVHGGSPEWPT